MHPFNTVDKELQEFTNASFSKGPVYHSIDQLNNDTARKEVLVEVTSAKVMYLNEKLLAHDFPQLTEENLKLRTDLPYASYTEQLKKWLIQQTAYISKPQAVQENVNTKIETTEYKNPAYRPSTYGRAVIYSVQETNVALYNGSVPEFMKEDKGLLDVKGVGISPGAVPSFRDHSNGLLSLQDAFIEYTNQLMIQLIFKKEKTDYHTLPIYGIIDLGFEIKNEHGDCIGPAALVIRRAHTRPENKGGLPKYDSPQQMVQLDIELLLRKYGLTSCNYVTGISIWQEGQEVKIAYGRNPVTVLTPDQVHNIKKVSHFTGAQMDFDGVNVQHTGEYGYEPSFCTLVDFGSYRVRPRFMSPILSLVSDRLLRWGGSIFVEMDQFVQPDEEIRVPIEYWGKVGEVFGFKAPLRDPLQDVVCEGIAKRYQKGECSADEVFEMLDAYLQTATSKWKSSLVSKVVNVRDYA